MRIFWRQWRAVVWLIWIIWWMGFPAAAGAASRGDIFLGYSRLGSGAFYANVGGQNGVEGALHIRLFYAVGLEGDAAHYGLGADASIPRTTTYLVGPRVSARLARLRLFAHALIGGEHSGNTDGFSDGAMAWAFGGGVDVPVAPFFAWRFAADYIASPTISPEMATHGRFNTGLVFRF